MSGPSDRDEKKNNNNKKADGEYSDFVTFYNTLKSDEVKEKFKDLVKAVDDVLYIEFVN